MLVWETSHGRVDVRKVNEGVGVWSLYRWAPWRSKPRGESVGALGARPTPHAAGESTNGGVGSGRPSAPNTHERYDRWANDERARATATGAPTHEGVTTSMSEGRRSNNTDRRTFVWAWAHAKTNRGSARVGRAPLTPTGGSARVGGRPSPVTRRFERGRRCYGRVGSGGE